MSRHIKVQRLTKTLDFGIRRKLRCIIWRQWKGAWTRVKNIMARGFTYEKARAAFNRRGPWWNAGTKMLIRALPPFYFEQLGLFNFEGKLRERRTTLT